MKRKDKGDTSDDDLSSSISSSSKKKKSSSDDDPSSSDVKKSSSKHKSRASSTVTASTTTAVAAAVANSAAAKPTEDIVTPVPSPPSPLAPVMEPKRSISPSLIPPPISEDDKVSEVGGTTKPVTPILPESAMAAFKQRSPFWSSEKPTVVVEQDKKEPDYAPPPTLPSASLSLPTSLVTTTSSLLVDESNLYTLPESASIKSFLQMAKAVRQASEQHLQNIAEGITPDNLTSKECDELQEAALHVTCMSCALHLANEIQKPLKKQNHADMEKNFFALRDLTQQVDRDNTKLTRDILATIRRHLSRTNDDMKNIDAVRPPVASRHSNGGGDYSSLHMTAATQTNGNSGSSRIPLSMALPRPAWLSTSTLRNAPKPVYNPSVQAHSQPARHDLRSSPSRPLPPSTAPFLAPRPVRSPYTSYASLRT